MALPAPVGYLYWYTTSIILALLTLLNAVNHIYRYITRPSSTPSAPLTAMPSPTKTFSSAASLESGRSQRPQLSALDRAARAARVVAEKCVILTALPLPNLRFWIKQRTAKSSISTAELTWQVCYVLGVLVLSFAGSELVSAVFKRTTKWSSSAGWDRLIVSNQAAWVAAAQVPLIIALAGKNNLVSCRYLAST
jgi:hypothetical protein